MKIQSLAFLFACLSSASCRSISDVSTKKSIFSKARRLEDGNNNDNGDDENDDEYQFLESYKLKFVTCKAGETVRDPETGEYEYNAVVFRLCPDNGDCDDEESAGCSSSYGDYVVGLNSFVEAYMEDQGDNMQYDENFNVEEYAECKEYQNDNDDGNGYPYYIGPACTEDGNDVKLQLFYDETCTNIPEDITFEDVSNGWSLPYEDGGLISTYCQSCQDYNDGAYELKEMCQKLYENSGKCETNMEYYHYYGKQEGACEFIETLMPVRKQGGSAGKVLGWMFLVLVVVGFAAYAVWWRKKKAAASAANGAGDGLMS